MKRVNKAQSVRDYMNANPDATTTEIAKKCKVTNQYVYQVKADEKKKEARKKIKLNASQVKVAKELNVPIERYAEVLVQKQKPKIRMQSTQDREWQPPELLPMPDPVNHPPHYKTGGVETIDFIEAKELGYHLGNVIKYVSRAKHKGNELEDLKKAQWYLERAIMKLHI